jgi:hypothetical protein
LQVDFAELAVSGLASMYPAFDWSVVLLAIMDISARAISLPDRPQRAIRVTSVRRRREDRTSISSHPLADLGGDEPGIHNHHREYGFRACASKSAVADLDNDIAELG